MDIKSFPELLNSLEILEVMKGHELFGTELAQGTIVNIHTKRTFILQSIIHWFLRGNTDVDISVLDSSSDFATLFKQEWIDNLDAPFINYMLSIYQYEIGRFYETEYPASPNKQMLDSDMSVFKLSCNLPNEFVYAIMCMDSFIEFLITRAHDDQNLIKHFTEKVTTLKSIQLDYKGISYMTPTGMLVNNILRLPSIKHRIRECIIDNILSNNKFTILDTSPVWVYMSVHG